MHPSDYARTTPDKPAIIMEPSGEIITYRQLNDRAMQGAQLFRSLGLVNGDTIALMMENNARFFEITWAAQRCGLIYCCISSKFNAQEAAYIVKDSNAKLLITSAALADLADEFAPLISGVQILSVGGAWGTFASFDDARARMPATAIVDESAGADLLYSSGTTGQPKGVQRIFVPGGAIDSGPIIDAAAGMKALHGFGPDTIYLSPSPNYHATALFFCMGNHVLGGTTVILEKFDAELCLVAIERRRVTDSNMVPTHFIRMLRLPEDVRLKYDLSSLRKMIHAAAPCPIPVKEQMIEWIGPIIVEFYSGTEGAGVTCIDSADWLTHKGSVGRAVVGTLHICGEDGEPLPPPQEGLVFFADGLASEYRNDPVKTSDARNKYGWVTLGDVGWLDDDGFLYLTDRKSFMIISGGVNIYPQEIENCLIMHPKVADVAVFGGPDPEMGEKVIAVIEPRAGVIPGPDLAAELIAYAREGLSHVKVPRQIDFIETMPRHDNGKLYKRMLRDTYWK